MKNFNRWITPAAVMMALAITSPLSAQGKGRDEYKERGQKAEQGQKAERGRKNDQGKPDHARKADRNDKHGARVANAALSRAHSRGAGNDVFVLDAKGDRVRIKNRSGAVLIDLDENRARTLGAWDVRPAIDRGDANAPSFCRSGAGHPNWGRQWCIDKGFGLGTANHVRWGSASTVGDIIFGRRVSTETLLRDALIGVVGDLAFNRLGLHAVTLGYAEPLTGVWVTDQAGPRVLQINSGTYPVAEIVDTNRDDRADVLVVALRAQ